MVRIRCPSCVVRHSDASVDKADSVAGSIPASAPPKRPSHSCETDQKLKVMIIGLEITTEPKHLTSNTRTHSKHEFTNITKTFVQTLVRYEIQKLI